MLPALRTRITRRELPETPSHSIATPCYGPHQILYEIRVPGESTSTAIEGDTPFPETHYGRVGYLHAGGVDRPLALWKGTELVLPYANWRGVYTKGTCPSAGCTDVWFPGGEATTFFDPPLYPNGPPSWAGSLLESGQDASGYQYKRNRYYDPKTGRFTQEDPLGLAGGLNLYGFAGGDPVNFSDPFGLCPPDDTNDGPECKVSLVGGTASYFVVLGGTVSAGRYINGEGEGWFLTLGIGVGLEAGGGVEGGTSSNRAALSNGALEVSGGAGLGAARSWNKDGKTTTGMVGTGVKVGGHVALTATVVTKPERPVDLRPNFDCSKPHPHNHVCNQ